MGSRRRILRHRTRSSAIVVGALALLSGCSSAPGAAGPAATPVAISTAIPSLASTAPPAPTTTSTSSAVSTTRPSAAASTSSGVAGVTSTTEPATEAPRGAITIVMTGPPPRYQPAAITASAGDLILFLQNDSPTADPHGVHTVAIGPDRDHAVVTSDEVAGGRRAVFTVRGLPVGEYVIWCTFPGHAGLGQVGTLTVE